MRTTTLLAIALVGLAGAWVSHNARGQAGPAGEPSPYAGKIVLVFSRLNAPTALENVELRAVGGRTMLAGRVIRDSKVTREPFPGSMVSVPWDEVTQIVEVERVVPAAKPAP